MNRAARSKFDRRVLFVLVSAWVWAASVPVAVGGQGLPDVGRAEFPNDDAVILRHLQHWTLQPDGGVVREEHHWVKLLNDRAWGRYADPRVDYLPGSEEVELIAARAHTPDGQKLDSPDYAINVVTPAGVSKWPTMTGWRQVCYTFSGVQNDAILELHYKRSSKPGVRRWLEADLRIGDIDPVVEQVVEVTLPSGTELRHRLDHVDQQHAVMEKATEGGQTTYRWKFNNIGSDADEPRCPPWQQRCGRLRFSNCPSAERWVEDILDSVGRSAAADERVAKFATEATKDEVDEVAKVRAIGKKMRDTFNFVDDHRGWVGRNARPVGEVFDSCYGSLLESAGLTLAALRAAGLEARATIAVEREQYDPSVSTDADLAAVVIEVAGPHGPIWLEPSSGILNRNGAWRDRDLLYVDGGKLQQFALASVTSEPDAVRVRGRLVLGEKAEKLTGELTIDLTGSFVNPEELRDDDQKRSRIESIVKGIMPDLKVTDFSVSQLSQSQLSAHASVESTEEPEKVYERRRLVLATDTPVLAEAHLPVEHSMRRTPIQLSGRFAEDVRVRIQLPEGWKPVVLPEPLETVNGQWGRITQTVDVDAEANAVQIVRQIGFQGPTIQPGDYAAVRDAVRAVRSERARSLVIEKTTE
ncbi:MAG TPA: DUF3857 domain-containing protein [Phycisphaerae bacterium]|nr:DUF3857 domain-containing protein [Phycisphaerae bacterium]